MNHNNLDKNKDFSNLNQSTDPYPENHSTLAGLLMVFKEDLIYRLITKLFLELIDSNENVDNAKNKYETFNVVSETGDSIYSPTIEELIKVVTKGKGEVFILENKFEEFVKKIIDHMEKV